MDFSENKNIFIQIKDWLSDQILQDKILAGDKVPSVRELAVDLEVNRNTVMRSYSLMEEEGILENKRGIGFFVATSAKKTLLKLQKRSFFEEDLPVFLHKVQVLKLDSTDLADLIQSIHFNDHEIKHN